MKMWFDYIEMLHEWTERLVYASFSMYQQELSLVSKHLFRRLVDLN